MMLDHSTGFSVEDEVILFALDLGDFGAERPRRFSGKVLLAQDVAC
jgi:hypothetical protein